MTDDVSDPSDAAASSPEDEPPPMSPADEGAPMSSADDDAPVCSPADGPPPDPAESDAPPPDDGSSLMTPANGASADAGTPPMTPVDPQTLVSSEPSTSNGASASPADDHTQDIPVWPHSVLELTAADVAPSDETETEPAEAPEDKPLGPAIDINRHDTLIEVDWSFKYVKVKGSLSLHLEGKLSPKEAQVTSGWDQGLFVALANEFKWGDWTVEPEIKFKRPVEEKDDPDNYLVEIEGACTASRAWSCGEHIQGIASVEVALVAGKLGKSKTDPEAKWECEAGEVTVTISSGYKGTVDTTDEGFPGSFEGSVSIDGQVAGEPEWDEIIESYVEEWGADLTCEVVADLVLAASVVAGAILTLVVNGAIIWSAWKLEETRDVTIPTLADSATSGFMDGVAGTNSGDPAAKMADADSAYKAGAAQGTKKRSDIVANKCDGDASKFDDWLKTHQDEVKSQAHDSFTEKLQIDLWTERAKDAAGSWKRSLPGGDAQALEDQYYAWIYIIGDCPVSRGGKWLNLWLANRVDVTDNPDRSAGNW